MNALLNMDNVTTFVVTLLDLIPASVVLDISYSLIGVLV